MEPALTIDTLRGAARAVKGHAVVTDRLRAVQAAQDALDAVKVELVTEMTETLAHEVEGASTPKAWLRRELRLDDRVSSVLIAAASTLRVLPLVAEAAARGELRLEHLREFAYSLKHIGTEITIESQQWMLDLARTCEPAEVHRAVKALREAVYPDELDEAWAAGMDRADVKITRVPDGWHLTGFLDIETGSKLDIVLRSLSAPRGAEDDRPVARRRVDGLDELLTGIIEHGLPQDRGVRPHMHVSVDDDTLADATADGTADADADANAADAGAETVQKGRPIHPGYLHGFGSIGPKLLAYLLCGSDVTPILTGDKHAVLDVGPTIRCATTAQRKAVNAKQGGECATPGCTNPVVHIHHVIWHSLGGPTDLHNLIGLCPACHTLVHQGFLHIDPDTHEFTTSTGAALPDRPSRYFQTRRAREHIRTRQRPHRPHRA